MYELGLIFTTNNLHFVDENILSKLNQQIKSEQKNQ